MAIHHYGPLASGKPFDRPKPKLPQIITFTSTPNAPKVSPAPLLGSRPPRVNIYTFGFFSFFSHSLTFFRSFLAIVHSKNGSFDFRQWYVKRRGLQQGSAFWGSHRYNSIFWGAIPQKPLKWGPGIGIPSLNETTNNFRTVSPISTHFSSIDAVWQMLTKNFHKTTGNES